MVNEKKGQARANWGGQQVFVHEIGHAFVGRAFWRGFGNVLSLQSPDHVVPVFVYHGRDISKTTSSDALSRDWKLVAGYIAAAVQGERGQDESDTE